MNNSKADKETLRDVIGDEWDRILPSDREEKIMSKLWDVPIIKKFSCGFNLPWFSWQEFAPHKNVGNWYLLENGYAVGYNENPSHGRSYPVKKLSPKMFEKAINHTETYEQYHKL